MQFLDLHVATHDSDTTDCTVCAICDANDGNDDYVWLDVAENSDNSPNFKVQLTSYSYQFANTQGADSYSFLNKAPPSVV